ncbi:hypothetical protein BGZ99_002745 [Dissophora globulifera]|uniref:CID domain-containing protein n=1 Tax=Dissophora globulifera TaxID=979702 RepID=A0A9P6UX47_9FUNG|nr:hypothetical protein BGZ99_002745 [Dissophora globulifera]
MYQQYHPQPHHQPHGGQPAGGQPNRDAVTQQMYRTELATLSFNSKPIITSLTIAAGDNVSSARVIVQTIEERLRTAPPMQKLPTLYLIDSIIKNVGGPYLNLFGHSIVSLFLDAYTVVDSSARASFEKVLGTWPNWNSQLFPREAIAKIEHGVQSIRQQQKQQQYQPPSSMHINPHYSDRPRENNQNYGPGHMLETIVKTTQLTPDNANMIRQQLAQLWAPPPAPLALPGFPPGGSSPMPPNMMMAPLPQHLQQPPVLPPNLTSAPMSGSPMPPPPLHFPGGVPPPHFPAHLQPPGSVPSPQAMLPGLPSSLPILPGGNVPIPRVSMAMPPVPPAATVPISAAPPAPAAASDLFASLMQSGLLGPNGSLTSQLLQNTANMGRASQSPRMGAAAVATPPMPLSNGTPLDRTGQNEQDQNVMSLGMIDLTSQDIQRRRPTAIQVMYGTPPLQCNQCGYRCPKSADAQKKMDAHLDWHFRQNRRMKDKAKKSHSRSWLVTEEDWIHSRESDLGQGQQPVFFDFGAGVSKTSKDELALQEEIAALREHLMSQSSLTESLCGSNNNNSSSEVEAVTDAALTKGCSVCKEKFIKVWNDTEDEWFFKNMRVVDKMIYHATCYADLVRSNQRQAALAAAAATVAVTAAAEAAAAVANITTASDMDTSLQSDNEPATSFSLKEAKAEHVTDQEMDSELPSSLKRKLELDQQEQEQQVAKKTILAEDA